MALFMRLLDATSTKPAPLLRHLRERTVFDNACDVMFSMMLMLCGGWTASDLSAAIRDWLVPTWIDVG